MVLTTGSNLIVPLVLWGKNRPSHTITSATFSLNQKTLLTGSAEGQICLWELDGSGKVTMVEYFGKRGCMLCAICIRYG